MEYTSTIRIINNFLYDHFGVPKLGNHSLYVHERNDTEKYLYWNKSSLYSNLKLFSCLRFLCVAKVGWLLVKNYKYDNVPGSVHTRSVVTFLNKVMSAWSVTILGMLDIQKLKKGTDFDWTRINIVFTKRTKPLMICNRSENISRKSCSKINVVFVSLSLR